MKKSTLTVISECSETWIRNAIILHREIYERFRASYKGKEDIHTRLMRKYKDIPSWWFHVLLGVTIAVSLVLCIFLNDQVQMPWWGLLFASVIAFIFTLPISVITATTNQVTEQTHWAPSFLCLFNSMKENIGLYTFDNFDIMFGSQDEYEQSSLISVTIQASWSRIWNSTPGSRKLNLMKL